MYLLPMTAAKPKRAWLYDDGEGLHPDIGDVIEADDERWLVVRLPHGNSVFLPRDDPYDMKDGTSCVELQLIDYDEHLDAHTFKAGVEFE